MKRIVWFAALGLLCCGCAAERRVTPPTEYKVFKLDPAAGEKELSKLLTEQARGGWEYVGPLNRKDEFIVLKRSPEDGRRGATTAAKTAEAAPKTTEKPMGDIPPSNSRRIPPDKE